MKPPELRSCGRTLQLLPRSILPRASCVAALGFGLAYLQLSLSLVQVLPSLALAVS